MMDYEILLKKIKKQLSNLIFMIDEDLNRIDKTELVIKIEDNQGKLIKKIFINKNKDEDEEKSE